MKKFLFCMFFAVLLIASGCTRKSGSGASGESSREGSQTRSSQPVGETRTTGSVTSYVPPKEEEDYDSRTAHFNSVNGLIKGLVSGFTEEVFVSIEYEEYLSNVEKGTFRAFHQKFLAKNRLVVPYYKEREMLMENFGEGYASITLLYREKFSRPWIFYNGLIDNNSIGICTMYLEDELVAEANEKGVPWLIRKIAPGTNTPLYPNIDTFQNYDYIETMYEAELPLDGFTVKALIKEDNDDPRLWVHFVHKDVFVIVRIYPEAFDNGLLKGLSFKTVPLK